MKETTTEFHYDDLDVKDRELTKQQAEKIHDLLSKSTEAVVEIGDRLNQVYSKIGHRHFRDWLSAEFRWSQPVASNYMQIAKKFGKLNCLEQFQPSALYALVRKNIPEKAVKEAIKLARSGESITKKRAIELILKHAPQANDSDSRLDRPVLEIMTIPTDLDSLRESFDTFCNRVEIIAVELTRTEREGLADRLLELALALRTSDDSVNDPAKIKRPVTKQKSRSRTSKPELEPIAV